MADQKLIVINSSELDGSTSEVMDWIKQFGGRTLRINENDRVTLLNLFVGDEEKLKFECKGDEYDLDEVVAHWYRRGSIKINPTLEKSLDELDSQVKASVIQHLNDELETLSNSIQDILGTRHSLGKRKNAVLDKISVLIKAKHIGFRVPETLVSSIGSEVTNFLNEQIRIITKSASDNLFLTSNNISERLEHAVMFTEEIKTEDMKERIKFFPSLFQKHIEKKIELRVFFLVGKCYPMAIFSQGDSSTQIDFRHYNFERPSRMVPYRLGHDDEKKINLLMNELDLKTGSLDFIVSRDNELVFLEVNPVGQFGMVSYPCNYKLEKEIAKYLLSDERKENNTRN